MDNIVAWPTCLLLIVLAFFLLFRKPIIRLIDRTKMLKLPGGVHAETSIETQSQAQSAQKSIEQAANSVEQLGSPHIEDLYTPIETDIRARISQSVPDPKHHFDWAVRLYAMAVVEKAHETNYRLIFGSQIEALKVLAQSGGVRTLQQLAPVYESAVFRFPTEHETSNFTDWYRFLLNAGYALLSPDGFSLTITPFGRNFLAWMAAGGLSESKAL